MTVSAIRKELHKAIDVIEDESFLKAVYTIINKQKAGVEYDLSPEEWEEIEYIQKQHKSGKSKSYSWDEVKKYAKSKLKA